MKKLIHKKLKKTSEKLKLFFKGFTIIELITVIAIIGVLASVILVYVTSYIGKSRDSRIKAEVSEIAKDAMMYYANNVSYEGYVVPSSFKPVVLGSDYEFLTDGVNSYVVYAKLSTSNAYWCIDHTGAVLQIDNPPNEGVYTCISGSGESGGEEINCGDGYCDIGAGENISTCDLDCPWGYCGDGHCYIGAGESCYNCEADCACPEGYYCEENIVLGIGSCKIFDEAACGDGYCDYEEGGENCESCPIDCGYCF